MESTRDDSRGAHEGEGRAPGGQAHPGSSWPLCKAVGALLSLQESQYPDKNHVQSTAQSELWISGNLRNGERVEPENAEIERDRETYPISEGLSPLPHHGDHGLEGKPFSHLGRRSRKEKKEGALSPSLPVARERRRGPSSSPRSTPTRPPSSPISPSPPPSIYSGPLSRNPLYPLLEHVALCFILLSNDVLPSYNV